MGRFSRFALPLSILAAALVFSLNHLVSIGLNHGDYAPILISDQVSTITFDEAHSYAPPITRFIYTTTIPAEVDDYELRGLSAGLPYLPLAIMGLIGKLAGLDGAFIVASFLFPAIALALLTLASAGFVRSMAARLLIAWATLLIPFGPRNFLWLGYDALRAQPDFTRAPQPEISFPITVGAALLLARALQRSDRTSLALAGLASAAVAYTYYFYATSWAIMLLALAGLALLWRNWQVFRRVVAIGIVTGLGAAPFVWATALGRMQGGQTNLLARVGAMNHTPDWKMLAAFVAGLAVVVFTARKWLAGDLPRTRLLVLGLLFLGAVGGLNLNVLTGYDAQQDHFYGKVILPLATLLAGVAVFRVAETRARLPRQAIPIACSALILALVSNAAARQVVVAERTAPAQRASDPKLGVLRWIAARLPHGVVVGSTDPALILMIPAVTPDFSYVPFQLRSLASNDEILQRYYALCQLEGDTPADVASIASARVQFWPSFVIYDIGYPGDAAAMVRDYAEQGAQPLRRLDYVILGAGRPIPASMSARFPAAHIVYSAGPYEVVALAA